MQKYTLFVLGLVAIVLSVIVLLYTGPESGQEPLRSTAVPNNAEVYTQGRSLVIAAPIITDRCNVSLAVASSISEGDLFVGIVGFTFDDKAGTCDGTKQADTHIQIKPFWLAEGDRMVTISLENTDNHFVLSETDNGMQIIEHDVTNVRTR